MTPDTSRTRTEPPPPPPPPPEPPRRIRLIDAVLIGALPLGESAATAR